MPAWKCLVPAGKRAGACLEVHIVPEGKRAGFSWKCISALTIAK